MAAAAGLGRDLARTLRRDRMLFAIALTVCLTGFAMQPFTGLRPDWEVVGRVFMKLGIVGAMAVPALVICKLGSLAVFARSRTPARDMLDWIRRFFAGPGLAANAASTVAIFCLYAGCFSVLKGRSRSSRRSFGTRRSPRSTAACTSAGRRTSGWSR